MANQNNRENIKDIRDHIDVINSELGTIKQDIATIKANWNWMRWIIGINVTCWGIAISILLKFGLGI